MINMQLIRSTRDHIHLIPARFLGQLRHTTPPTKHTTKIYTPVCAVVGAEQRRQVPTRNAPTYILEQSIGLIRITGRKPICGVTKKKIGTEGRGNQLPDEDVLLGHRVAHVLKREGGGGWLVGPKTTVNVLAVGEFQTSRKSNLPIIHCKTLHNTDTIRDQEHE